VGAQDRFELAAQGSHAALELGSVAGVLVDLPHPKQLLADPQPGFAEGLLGGEAFGVRGEVALQVRPADLAAAQRQVRVGPPAIRRDDRAGVREQSPGLVLVAIGRDAQHGMAVGESAPQACAGCPRSASRSHPC
jgi:hypothetical protein